MNDLTRIGHAELLTPKPDESLAFFVDILGMEIEAREGQSVYLRGWGDYLRYSLKLTEAPQAGMGHMALRARARRRSTGPSRRSRRPGTASSGSTATSATGLRTASTIRTAMSSSCTTRPSGTSRPTISSPRGATSRRRSRAAAPA